MILRLEILSIMSYRRKKIYFLENYLKLTKNNTFYNVFCNIIFSCYRFLSFYKNDWIFINYALFFRVKYSLYLYTEKKKLLNQQMSSAGIGTADFFCNIYRFFCWIHRLFANLTQQITCKIYRNVC